MENEQKIERQKQIRIKLAYAVLSELLDSNITEENMTISNIDDETFEKLLRRARLGGATVYNIIKDIL